MTIDEREVTRKALVMLGLIRPDQHPSENLIDKGRTALEYLCSPVSVARLIAEMGMQYRSNMEREEPIGTASGG